MTISALFLDVGGVLLTNGWDRKARQAAAETFALDLHEIDDRHHLTFDTYEVGKLTLDEYLQRTIFYQPRPFTVQQFKDFMFAQSQRLPDMIEYVQALKQKHRLKVAVVSNEGRELTSYRLQKFRLGDFVDFFIFSGFVHLRKPDADIFRLALDVAQVPAAAVAYVDDRPMFAEVARGLGIHGIHHQGYASTRAELEKLGLTL
jgi:putative hydrolase of the HAD superfamily